MTLLASACATTKQPSDATIATPEQRAETRAETRAERGDPSEPDADPSRWVIEGEAALEREQPAKAATLFARYLAYRSQTRVSPDLQDPFGSPDAPGSIPPHKPATHYAELTRNLGITQPLSHIKITEPKRH